MIRDATPAFGRSSRPRGCCIATHARTLTAASFSSPYEPKPWTVIRRGYRLDDLRHDAIAGLTVAIVALPLAMALATGTTPVKGLHTAIIAGFLISFLGGSRVQIGGPTAAFIPVVFTAIEKFGYGGPILSTLLAGFMLTAAGRRSNLRARSDRYPAKAGFHSDLWNGRNWIPAFAGMTGESLVLDRMRLRRRRRIADHIDALRRRELKCVDRELHVALPCAETNLGAVAERVLERHAREARAIETEIGAFKLRLLVLRFQAQPGDAVVPALFARRDIAIELRQIGQHGQRTVRLFGALRAHADLFEIGVVNPDFAAIGDDGLLERSRRVPAKLSRRLECERAATRFGLAGIRIDHGLLEAAGNRIQSFRKRIQTRARVVRGNGRRGRDRQKS